MSHWGNRILITPLFRCVCFAGSALLTWHASAELLVYEGFDGYTAGQLPGQAIQSSTIGLDQATTIIGGGTAAVNQFASEGLLFSNLQVTGGRAAYASSTGAASYIGYRYNGTTPQGTLYTSFLTRIDTAPNNASSVGLRINTANNASVSSAYFYSFADTTNSTFTGIQYENSTTGVLSSGHTLPTGQVHLVIGRFTRVGQTLSAETPGIGTIFVLTRDQFDHFKAGGFTDSELDAASIGSTPTEVLSRVTDSPVTSGTFNILAAGRGIQFGVGNASTNQVVAYDEIRMGTLLDDVVPLAAASHAVVTLQSTRATAPEPVAGNDLPGEILATRTGSTAGALSVHIAATGNATSGVDFVPVASVDFQPGQATVVIPVKPYTDALAEGEETVTLTLLAGEGYTVGEPSVATVAIQDRPFDVPACKSRFIQKAEAGIPQKIVVYGTSLTAGGIWAGQMLTALQAAYPGMFSLVNSGGSGMESNWGVANLQTRVIDHNPDVVFIEFSVNDAAARFDLSLAQANANLLSMVQSIRTALPACEIILQVMNPVIDRPEGDPGWRPNLPLYQNGYRRIGRENGLLVIDHMPAWQAVLDEGDEVYRSYVPDGLHPGADGYQRFVTPVILESVGADGTDAPGIIVDDPAASAVGTWTASTANPGYHGTGYVHDGNTGKGTKSMTFTPQIPVAGTYPVYLRWTADANRASNVPVTILHAAGTAAVVVNQKINGGTWFLLGSFPFAAGDTGNVRIDTTGTDGFVIADAVGIGFPAVMIHGTNGRAAEPPSSSATGRTSTFILNRSGSTSTPLTVMLEVTGNAIGGADYASLPVSVTIPAGAASASVTLAPLMDSVAEGDETFRVRILPDTAYALSTPSKASVAIEDRPVDAWRFHHFDDSQLADPLVSGDLADPDRDSLPNLLECLTGHLPGTPDSAGAVRHGVIPAAGDLFQTITYDRMLVDGLTGTPEVSTDLVNWSTNPTLLELSILSDDGIKQVVQVRSRTPLGDLPSEFLRLKVVAAP